MPACGARARARRCTAGSGSISARRSGASSASSAEENRTLRAGYGYRPGNALELGLEATRREAANDDAPGHEVILRARIQC